MRAQSSTKNWKSWQSVTKLLFYPLVPILHLVQVSHSNTRLSLLFVLRFSFQSVKLDVSKALSIFMNISVGFNYLVPCFFIFLLLFQTTGKTKLIWRSVSSFKNCTPTFSDRLLNLSTQSAQLKAAHGFFCCCKTFCVVNY